VGFVPRGKNTPVSSFGAPARGWKGDLRLSECQDNQTLIAALHRLWESRPAGDEYDHPYFIGVHLNQLVPDALHTLNLFDATEESQERTRLTETMDALNEKYGLTTLAPASMLAAYRAAPTRIAFHSVPEVF
jgi:DNA polymerase-4